MAKYEGTVLVVGGTGGVGARIVKLLQSEGITPRLLVRDPLKAASLEKQGLEVMVGDLTDEVSAPVTLKLAMNGIKAVLSALGSRPRDFLTPGKGLKGIDYYGTRRLVDAARAAGVEHFVLNSTMGVSQKRSITKPFSILFYPKWQAEAYLVKSGLTYTIFRPGGLVDSEAELKAAPGAKRSPVLAAANLRGGGGFEGLGRVLRQDVAEAMVKSLTTPATYNQIYDILDRSSVKPEDRRKILKDVFDN